MIADAHIYDRHIPLVEQIIKSEPYAAPKFRVNPDITDFYAFTPDDITLDDYRFHKLEGRIPIAE